MYAQGQPEQQQQSGLDPDTVAQELVSLGPSGLLEVLQAVDDVLQDKVGVTLDGLISEMSASASDEADYEEDLMMHQGDEINTMSMEEAGPPAMAAAGGRQRIVMQ